MRRLFGLRRTQLGVAAFLGVVALVASVTAHVRLRTSDGGSALYWSDPSNVPIAIGTTGSDDLDDGSHETAIRSAIEAWNAAGGSSARLVESFDPGTRARRDWESRDVQLVLFDESNTSGFFTGASGTVAVTPVSFRQSGRIVDADVLFNGEDFRFSTSGESGRFDVQDLATHELGHYLGLDHSGVCGATMYPFVDPTIVLHRSLSLDDRGGVRAAYPSTSFGSISGRVVRAGSDARVRGAHVVARSAEGRVMGATLTDDDGLFTVEGLDAGTYTVYAAPLDGPVTEANLGSVDVLDDDFEATTLGTIQVESGSLAVLGMQTVGPDVEASLGRVSDNYPLRAVMGLTRTMVVRGSGLVAGSTLTISDPTIALTNVAWFGSSVSFDITIPPNAAPGHVDLTLDTPSTGSDVLVGAIEITPPDPIVTSVTPGAGTLEGGEAVTIVGSHFRQGVRVVIGNRIYRDGDANGCQVVDANTITLTTRSTIAGSHDVVVIDPTGVEGRDRDAYEVAAVPTIASVFPSVGASAGGTTLRLAGEHFVPGMVVDIDGTVQTGVAIESPQRMRIVTSPGVPGGPYVLTVTSPRGDTAETAFTYVLQPDPRISSIAPARGDRSGGTTVTILGTGFDANSRVVVGAGAANGAGGVGAATAFVDATTLRATMPSFAVGPANVMVRNAGTGQASVVESGFVYTSEDQDDGGGCAAVPAPGPPSWRRALGGAGWILVLLLVAAIQARRPFAAAAIPRA